ncbi:MAG: NADPH-dependent F420 reductase [Anaerolineales bacterium]|nr:NADPH-dependent F420 reductase [Anaerolineales bacterium]
MSEKQISTIGILGGTGKEGQGLAMRWANAGYRIIIGSRQLEKAKSVAEELRNQLGLDTVSGMANEDAAREADLNVLTVVQSAHQSALLELKDALQGKILVDATARVEFQDPKPPAAPSAGRIAQNLLGDRASVVAAFQNVPATALKKNLGEAVKGTDVLICSDDVEAAEVVLGLARDAGMQAYYAGDLDNALIVEGLTALLISMNKHYGGHGSITVSGLKKQPIEN